MLAPAGSALPYVRSITVQPPIGQDAFMTGDEEAPSPDWSGCIVAIARDHDVARFAQLFVHFAPMLKGFFMRSGVAPGVAEDIAQDAMLAVWHKASYFDPARASASTWIFTIARNLRVDMKRRERGMTFSEDPNPEISNPMPCDNILSLQRDAQIHAAVLELPEDQAEVIRLSFFEDWPHPDIAAALNIPLGTVKSRIRLAMVRLRALVEDPQ